MKKLMILIFISMSLYANDFDIHKELEKLQYTYTPKKIAKYFSDFKKITGENDKNFNKYIEIFRNDIHSLRFLKISSSVNTNVEIKINNKKESVKIPNYKKALKELSQIKSNNVLGAYAAVSYLSENLFSMDPSGKYLNNELKQIISTYYKKPLKILMHKNYCYGYLMTSNYLSPKTHFLDTNNKIYLLYKSITKKGFRICKKDKDKIPDYLVKNMSHGYAYLIAYEKLYKH